MLSLLDNVFLQGLGYASAVIGVAVAFRVLRYPDLTADGSFIVGAAVTAASLTAGAHFAFGVVFALAAGVAAGVITAVLNAVIRVNRLLSGILTSMMCYSLAFRVLGGRSNLGLLDRGTLFSAAESFDSYAAIRSLGIHPAALVVSAVVVSAVAVLLYFLLKSDYGLVLRAVGANESLVADLGRRPVWYRIFGLGLANGLVALSGGLIASRQGFADVNMGIGVIIVLIAALVIGEECLSLLRADPARRLGGRILAPVIGAVLYFLLFLLMLRASTRGWMPFRIEPTDLKLLSAGLVAAVYVLRARRASSEELLPV